MKDTNVWLFILWAATLAGMILLVNLRVSVLEERLNSIEPALHIPKEISK
jgi:hypothetical protein